MTVLFISHASKDDALASAVERWLTTNGFIDIFVDHQAIAGGDKWREALRKSSGSTRVVLCIITNNWLNSIECFNEFRVGWLMGKRIIPLFLLPPEYSPNEQPAKRLAEVMAEDQGIDLWPCVTKNNTFDMNLDEAATTLLATGLRAAGALARVGLDPEAFEVNRQLRHTPFPGLTAFGDEDADAALFYGRSREIAETLEELRKMRAERDQRPLVIIGSSGSGKSSLLKAGIIPRLRRESPAWLPLRAFHPGADPLLNFAECLSKTYADFGKNEAKGIIRDRLFDHWRSAERDVKQELTHRGLADLEKALEGEGAALRKISGRLRASILISVDQAEELVRGDSDYGEALADYLRVALSSSKSTWLLAFTIRTDSFPELQRHRRFQNLKARGYDLRTLPTFRFNDVVEEPAKRYGVKVDIQLIDTLMEDAPKEDALPLLAFAMQRLWGQYGDSGELTKDNYDKVGGLTGLIEDAAERALQGIEPEQDIPVISGSLPKRVDVLGASTFVPPLAQINDQGKTIRRVSQWTKFSEEQQDLLSRFDRWRLVVRKGPEINSGGDTVEVAHEALFRKWGRLRDWLEPERARLEALRSLKAATQTWQRHDCDKAYLDHREQRLVFANALGRIETYAARLDNREIDYLAACAKAEQKEMWVRWRMKAILRLLVAGIGIGAAGWWQQDILKTQYHYRFRVLPFVLNSAQEVMLKPGDKILECAKNVLCPDMIILPAGEFKMGSPEDEGNPDQRPLHKVTIPTPFAVSKFEITFDQWDVCVTHDKCNAASDTGWGRGDRPVINVSWHDAQTYVKWLSGLTGKNYRLLSEAEWEYAARAGTSGSYSFEGSEDEHLDYGRTLKNSGQQTNPVGSRKPNFWGLYDMHGNVWEWCADSWHSNYDGNLPIDGSVWQGGDVSRRILRGGSWNDGLDAFRPAHRIRSLSVNQSLYVGFRVARSISSPRSVNY